MTDEAQQKRGLPLHVNSMSVCFHSRQSGELIWALRNCSLTVEAAESIGVTGVSGGGKSTLARALLGLIDSRPGIVSGTVTETPCNETELGFCPSPGADSYSDWSRVRRTPQWKQWHKQFVQQAAALRQSGAFLMLQEPRDTLNPYIPVGKMLARASQKTSGGTTVEQALDLVELPTYVAERYPSELSTGMCQRVHLAMALSSGIRLLIADEPLIRLDMRIRTRVADLLSKLQKERRFTLVLLSHDIHLLRNVTDRLLVLQDGEVVESGPTSDVWEKPAENYTRKLFTTYRTLFEPTPPSATESDVTAVSLTGVKKQFGDVKAVDDVSLDVSAGECVGLLGESGCGKTTLARLIIGLDSASEGSIELRLADTGLFRPDSASPDAWRKMRSSLQLVYQDADSALDPVATASEAVEEAYQIHYPKLTSAERNHLVRRLFDELNLPEKLLASQCCYLSGGEARRVIIAQSMAALGAGLDIENPGARMLVADEPTTGLDADNCESLIQFLETSARAMSLTMLIISHDLPILRRLCTRVNVMYAGRIVETGGPDVIQQKRPAVRHPFTDQILDSSQAGSSDEGAAGMEGGCAFFAECSHPSRDKVKCSQPPPLEGTGDHLVACWFEPVSES